MQPLPELLNKYYSSHCTAEERAVVEQWLVTEEEQMPLAWSVPESEQEVKTQIWAGISGATRHASQVKTIRRYSWLAGVACVLAFLMMIKLNPLLFSRTISIDNEAGEAVAKLNVGALQFAVQPHSRCSIELPLWGEAMGRIKICGAVSVVNSSGANTSLHIDSDSVYCPEMNGSDAIHLAKGQTYMAMTDQKYHLISATNKELLDGLPRLFSARLIERFKL